MRIETERLRLRPFEERDLLPLGEMSADPRVMEFFSDPLDLHGTKELMQRLVGRQQREGIGMVAAERKSDGAFVGIIGLQHVPYEERFTPAVEVGWRLAHPFWGQGYATEGARACLAHAFEQHSMSEVVAIAHVGNVNSHRVMERLGMRRDEGADFDHPSVSPESPLARHGLWRIAKADWLAARS
ncbi:putative ribosomal N-acetyltransferase YdaF [Hartmannibacter diazotrophicus]|uniref:Putative ribosomal N-acetyltransferase YdaF n=1 Tax=Hartmannibacter diazotrophicus TaxID=1482074 RepID=A0A2C9D9J6_9HYPH|nr:GNAT family N-acetyltransferase [Hartmannibacter diazotrophicus]SON56411.1 putative ribosomal N-acetyltransferase YdaF [Hartmannibacter diazotrophicus]